MAEVNDWNARVIAEFRANGGKVGGNFEGAPVVLMHHVGRKSGNESVNPVMYLPGEDADTIYVFASKGGHPAHPDWYWNMTEAGTATVEVGAETYPVTVTEVVGDDRDRIYAEQASRYPGFAEYAEKTAGVRTIPVLALTRVR
jgi:deazaflavin-dependent oxidoreductase (nitroreductase family)